MKGRSKFQTDPDQDQCETDPRPETEPRIQNRNRHAESGPESSDLVILITPCLHPLVMCKTNLFNNPLYILEVFGKRFGTKSRALRNSTCGGALGARKFLKFHKNLGKLCRNIKSIQGHIFNHATAFNQPIGSWNVSKMTNMAGMFSNAKAAKAFNQPVRSIPWILFGKPFFD